MTMEKGMSSGEGLPSRSSQVSAGKITAKELETKQSYKEKRGGFVLVHAGAGYHSESKAKEYKHVCKRACQKAIEKLQAGALATDAVTAALVELEDVESILCAPYWLENVHMLYKLRMLTKPCWRLCKTSLSVHLSLPVKMACLAE
uniref:Isoform 3 of Threonine aspartase 1 n=1 Tax=Homo sapiens TaxID=9606 RepID=Q9H6P5-3|nr:unnamed protein product [Homo sapiens]